MSTIISWDIGIKNLTFCIVKKTSADFDILRWDKCPFDYNKNGPVVLIQNLYAALALHSDILTVDCIIIEKQPAKNKIMTSIQNALISYYLLKTPSIPIKMVHSNKKFAVKMNGKKNYTKRKMASVEICRAHLCGKADELKFFDTLDKKDDHADCLNLALL
jgi:hypothetical protein